jgi:membrane protein
MVLGLVLISTASLIASGVFQIMASYGDLESWVKGVHDVGDFLVYAFFFTIILRWIPDRQVKWKAALYGGILTAVLFTVGKTLIGLYLTRAAVGSTYGVAGSLIVTLVWVYYSALIFLFGAEIASMLCEDLETREKKQTLRTGVSRA